MTLRPPRGFGVEILPFQVLRLRGCLAQVGPLIVLAFSLVIIRALFVLFCWLWSFRRLAGVELFFGFHLDYSRGLWRDGISAHPFADLFAISA